MSDIDLKALVEAFGRAAQVWGWEADQGVTRVQQALDEYEKTKAALLDGIEAAEQRSETAEKERDALPELGHVITWLANGCSVAHAIEELRIYKARIDAEMAQGAGAEKAPKTACHGVDSGVEGGAGMGQEFLK